VASHPRQTNRHHGRGVSREVNTPPTPRYESVEDWDRAASSKNRDRMIELLGEVELADQAEQIADLVLSDPKRYGF